MNKRLFYYLFAVLCTVTLFTSCSDDDGDDTPTVIPTEQEIAGDYKGTMDVYYVKEKGSWKKLADTTNN